MTEVKKKRSRDEVVFTWPIVLLLIGSFAVLAGSIAMKPVPPDGTIADFAVSYSPPASVGGAVGVVVAPAAPAQSSTMTDHIVAPPAVPVPVK